jgi:sialate O-acetylesterase
MVVITDLVDDTADIHPHNKHDVGLRLANYALGDTYRQPGIVYKSPIYKSMTVQKGKAYIEFENAPNGLVSKDKVIKEVMIAGNDKVFYPAQASIEKDKLVVWNKEVKDPVAVRFAFRNAAVGNLFSKEGLPVTPFRTDNWEFSAN